MTPNLKKLDDRRWPMVFIGFELGSKTYRTYDPVSKKVIVLRDIVFDEQAQWDWNKGVDHDVVTDTNDTLTVETEYSTVVQGVPAEDASVAGSPQPPSPPPSPVVVAGGDDVQEETIMMMMFHSEFAASTT
jgi:hypothetical protein